MARNGQTTAQASCIRPAGGRVTMTQAAARSLVKRRPAGSVCVLAWSPTVDVALSRRASCCHASEFRLSGDSRSCGRDVGWRAGICQNLEGPGREDPVGGAKRGMKHSLPRERVPASSEWSYNCRLCHEAEPCARIIGVNHTRLYQCRHSPPRLALASSADCVDVPRGEFTRYNKASTTFRDLGRQSPAFRSPFGPHQYACPQAVRLDEPMNERYLVDTDGEEEFGKRGERFFAERASSIEIVVGGRIAGCEVILVILNSFGARPWATDKTGNSVKY